MAEETKNQDAVNTGNPTPTEGIDTLTALKEEVTRLTEENKVLSETLSKMENDRDIYKRLWSEKDDKLRNLLSLTKELVKFAELA